MSIDIRREWSEWEDVLPAPAWTGSTTNPVIGNGTIAGKLAPGHRGGLPGIVQFGTTTTFGTGEWRIALPAGGRRGDHPRVVDAAAGQLLPGGTCLYVPAGGAAQTGLAGWPRRHGAAPGDERAHPRSITGTVPTAFVAAATNFLSWQIRFECQPGS